MRLILSSIRGLSLRTARFSPLFAGAGAALAAWLSQGTVAFTTHGSDRIALLPMSAGALAIAALAGVAVGILAWRARTSIPALLLMLVALPWLPFDVPAALLVWSAPLVIVVWVAVCAILLAAARLPFRMLPQRAATRPTIAAGLLAAVVYSLTAWQVAPSRLGGDEPHYLIITQSLLYDHDLKIENNHRRGDYRAYFTGELRPDFLRRGRDREIYSIHAPGISALVLPAFAVAGYNGVVLFLILIASATAGLSWWLSWRVTGRRDAAWFGWAAVVLAPTAVLNAFTVYPDGVGGAAVLTGVWALVRARDERSSGALSVRPWLVHGAALAVLPWLHTRFALLAGGLGALVLLHLARTRNPVAKASAFLSIPAVSALAWLAFFSAIYGVPDPAIPYRGSDLGSPSYILNGLAGLLFDQQYGLLVYAPVLSAALVGLVVLARSRGEFRWLPAELVFVAAPYVLTVTQFPMWWGGLSAPARFALPLVPSLAIPAAATWAAAVRRGTRALMTAGILITASISSLLVFVERGRFAYHGRELYAEWLPWLARTVDLQRALPSFFASQRVVGRMRAMDSRFYAEILVWIAAASATWAAVRAFESLAVLRTRPRLATATSAMLALASMAATSTAWRIEGTNGFTPAVAQLDLLRATGRSTRAIALDLSRVRRLVPAELVQLLTIEAEAPPVLPAVARDDRPLFALDAIPAGDYRLTVGQRSAPSGWLMVGVGRDQFAIVMQPASAFATEIPIRLPVDVRSIVVRGDEDARRAGAVLRLRPVSIMTPAEKAAPGMALHAVRYQGATLFFMDARSFPEPNAFWAGGSCESSVVVQTDIPRPSLTLLLRNAPVANRVEMQTGRWSATIELGPREERRVVVPLGASRGATMITFTVAAGFRPSSIDPATHDERFLGLWVALDADHAAILQ